MPSLLRRMDIPKPQGGGADTWHPDAGDAGGSTDPTGVTSDALADLRTHLSVHSYGFRAGKNAHQAVQQAQRYVAERNRAVVDLELEKFFDRVCHDLLMGRLAKRIADRRVLQLIRRSRRAEERLRASLTRFLAERPKLKVYETKSAVARHGSRSFWAPA